MNWIVYVSSAQRIVVDVFKLLQTNLHRFNNLRMTAFLPDLILVGLVPKLEKTKLLQQV